MTEYWKSVGNYYCDYCKAFIRDDAFNRRNHEGSERHQNALKRQVRNIHKKHEQEARDQARTNRELAKMGAKVALVEKKQDSASRPVRAAPVAKKLNVGVRTKQEKVLEDAEVQRQMLAAQATAGQWEIVNGPGDATEQAVKKESQEDEDKAEMKPSGETNAQATLAQALKRSREGHDDEMLGYKVAVMTTPVDKDAEVGPTVAFKKRKPKDRLT